MSVAAIMAMAVVVCVIAITVKQIKPEMAVVVGICTVCVITAVAMSQLFPLIEIMENADTLADISQEHLKIVIKAVGMCVMTQFASDVCKSANENAIASAVEVCGRVAVLVISMPLISEILSVAIDMAGG